MTMKLSGEEQDGVTVIRFEDAVRLVAHEMPRFQAALAEWLPDHGRVVLDMSRVAFIDSSGVGALVELHRLLKRRGGELRLAGMTHPVATVFELARLYRFIKAYDTVEQAVRSFSV